MALSIKRSKGKVKTVQIVPSPFVMNVLSKMGPMEKRGSILNDSGSIDGQLDWLKYAPGRGPGGGRTIEDELSYLKFVDSSK